VLSLTEQEREQLKSRIGAGSTPQSLVFRARVVLRAADPDCPPEFQFAAELSGNHHTVAVWRDRYFRQGLAGLQDAPRSGRPQRFFVLARVDLVCIAAGE
jgi:hypothetical protein